MILPEKTIMVRDSMLLVETADGRRGRSRTAWFPRGPAISVDYPRGYPRGADAPARPQWFFLPDATRAAQDERIATRRVR